MPILFGEAKKIVSQYAGIGGKCPSNDEVNLFLKQVLQYMLFSGQNGNIRKFCFHAMRGCFTAPYELEVPLKVKIDGHVGSAWDKWFEYHQNSSFGSEDGCFEASDALLEETDYFPTAFELPHNGSRVATLGTCLESEDAHIIVTGTDNTGREIFTTHRGEKISGEYLSIVKDQIRYTSVDFAKITSIKKSVTNGYVQLRWVDGKTKQQGFLSDYSPVEEKPAYRRFRLSSRCNPTGNNSLKVSILGRIRLKENYADTDRIPFENLYALSLAAQAINSQYNDNLPAAQAKDATMQDIITRENEYKRVQNGQPMEVFVPLSMGAVRNIVS
jgi:hypothetical protein